MLLVCLQFRGHTKGLILKSAPWFFFTFLARGINIPRCVFHFKCGRGSLQAWADVDSKFNVGSDFCCVWQVDVVLHAGAEDGVFSF